MRTAQSTILGCFMISALTACGGGGGGGNPAVAFSGFSNLPENGTTSFTGTARDSSFIQSSSGNTITVGGFNGSSPATASVVTQGGEIVAITVSGPDSNLTLDTRAAATVTDLVFTSPDGHLIAMVDPEALGFEYQTFGLWLVRSGLNGQLGVGSFGMPTPAGSLPSMTATYLGESVGYAVDGIDGDWFITGSTISISTDFSTASINSTDTEILQVGTGDVYTAPNLDFSGTGPVAGTGFSAPITAGIGLTGDAAGKFHGPNAQEVGGTFNLSNSSGVHYAGSFGAKR